MDGWQGYQIKTTRYHLITFRMATLKKTNKQTKRNKTKQKITSVERKLRN